MKVEDTNKQTAQMQKGVGGQWIDEEQKYWNERIFPGVDQCLKMKKTKQIAVKNVPTYL